MEDKPESKRKGLKSRQNEYYFIVPRLFLLVRALWNLVNYNDKTTNVSFKELKKRLTTRGYFKDFLFDGTTVSTSRHRVSDYVYF